ncbi:protein hunchback [Lasius niger]|uniref:Protein hunchback n=1 Tax=Lasius niger TaxID=67767 RepID=A0A0J7KTK0_LASNI|nr:protein hunchback [Lasius niger]
MRIYEQFYGFESNNKKKWILVKMDEYDKMIIHHALNQRQQIAEKQHCHSFALDDRSMKEEMSEKHGNNDSGIGCSPLGVKLEDERNESLPSSSGQSPTIESTHPSYSEKLQTEAFRMRGDVDHVFTDSVKCALCDFKPTRFKTRRQIIHLFQIVYLYRFQYYHHIIVHCKRTNDSDFETDPAQTLNTESLRNGDDFLEEMQSKKKKRRKNIKPKSCKFRNCNFVTTEGLDVMEAKKELWTHMRNNHNYPLVCRLCPFVTEPKHHMVYHWLGDHTKLRPFRCEEPNCSYSCVAKSMLNSHVVRHWNVHQYNCKDCHFKARLLHAMKKHMREKKHSHVLVLNEDGTQNLKAVIDVYSNKRGPRRKIPAKNQDKSNQSDLNQSSSSIASPESHQELISHSETQQQLQSVESDSNVNDNNNQSNLSIMYSSLIQTLYNMSDIITDAILHWNNDNQNPTSWHYLIYMFHRLFGEDVTSYCNRAHMTRLDCLFAMRKVVAMNIENLGKYKIDYNNSETSINNGAGPSNGNVNDTDRPSTFNELEYQPETQDIPMIDYVNFETTDSEAGPSDDKKDTDQVSTSNKRKTEPERLDDVAMTGNNYFDLTNNKEAGTSNKISNEISTSEGLEFQPQRDMIPNKPLSISKFKITGATKRKSKAQARFVVEENTERNETESVESSIDSECDLQRESQISLVTKNDENLNNNCEHCDLTFGNKLMHVMHMHFHKINDPYTCNACGKKCSDSLTFNCHLIYGKH